MNDTNEKLDRILTLLEALLAGKTPGRRKVDLAASPEAAAKLREDSFRRVFNKLAHQGHYKKSGKYFPHGVVQPPHEDATPWEAVPLSVFVNRLEMLRAFWPVAGEPDLKSPRDVVKSVLTALVERGEFYQCPCVELYPQGNEVVIVVSAAELAKRRELLDDADEEIEEEIEEEDILPRTPAKSVRWSDLDEEEDA